jgi:hypothetical protein
MNTPPVTPSRSAATTKSPRAPRGSNQARHLELEKVSPEARKKAAAVLEVLAGVRTPLQAAQALGLALPGYYNLELRALQGLMAGCEPTPKGRQKDANRELTEARRQCAKLTAEMQRYQALARATQRTIGLNPPPPASKKPPPGKRPRKPVVRALAALALLKGAGEAAPPPAPAASLG